MPKSSSPLKDPPNKRKLLRGLERAAGEINPFLTILAIGIAILDLTCYAGLASSRQVVLHSTAYAATPSVAPAPEEPISFRR
jgi:hypothetical protein